MLFLWELSKRTVKHARHHCVPSQEFGSWNLNVVPLKEEEQDHLTLDSSRVFRDDTTVWEKFHLRTFTYWWASSTTSIQTNAIPLASSTRLCKQNLNAFFRTQFFPERQANTLLPSCWLSQKTSASSGEAQQWVIKSTDYCRTDDKIQVAGSTFIGLSLMELALTSVFLQSILFHYIYCWRGISQVQGRP